MFRTCHICRQTKELDEFGRDSKSPNGYGYRCLVCVREIAHQWRVDNRERSRSYAKRQYLANTEQRRAYCSKYAKKNRERLSKIAAERYRTDAKVNIRTRMMSRLSETIKVSKPRDHKWFVLLGYNVEQLKRHLEKQFQTGMTWDNYGEWHIDHVIPIAAFNYSSTEDIDFKRCWALENLQPLWANENLTKHAKIFKPFQPSLAMAV